MWFQKSYKDATQATIIGTDGSYKVKGQGTSAFVVMTDNDITHTHTQLVATHSSYDTEMHAVHNAIEYVTEFLTGQIIVFIDNQSAIQSTLNVKAHSLFEMSRKNIVCGIGLIPTIIMTSSSVGFLAT